MGDLYLNIVESKNKETGGFDRQSVILFADDLQQFLKGFDESLKVMEKAVREKRHGIPSGREDKPFRKEKPNREDKHFHREKPNRSGKERRHDHRPEGGRRDGGKRIVVRQKKTDR